MATAHVQTKDAQTGSGTSLGVNLTGVGAGNHLVVSTADGSNGTLNIATSSPSATWQNAVAQTANGTSCSQRMDYTENTASGSWTVTGHSAATQELTVIVSESSGVATSSSIGATNHGTSTTATVQPGSITPASGSILYTSVTDAGGDTPADTIDSSFLVSSDSTAWNGSNQRAGQAHKDNVANSAVNPTWTRTNGAQSQVSLIAEFKAAAASSAVFIQENRYLRIDPWKPARLWAAIR